MRVSGVRFQVSGRNGHLAEEAHPAVRAERVPEVVARVVELDLRPSPSGHAPLYAFARGSRERLAEAVHEALRR